MSFHKKKYKKFKMEFFSKLFLKMLKIILFRTYWSILNVKAPYLIYWDRIFDLLNIFADTYLDRGTKKNFWFFSAFRIGVSGMHHATFFRKHLLRVLINISVNYQSKNLGTALDYLYPNFSTSMHGRFL